MSGKPATRSTSTAKASNSSRSTATASKLLPTLETWTAPRTANLNAAVAARSCNA